MLTVLNIMWHFEFLHLALWDGSKPKGRRRFSLCCTGGFAALYFSAWALLFAFVRGFRKIFPL